MNKIKIVLIFIISVVMIYGIVYFVDHYLSVYNEKNDDTTVIENEVVLNSNKVKDNTINNSKKIYKERPYVNPDDVLTEKEKMYVSHAGGKYGENYYLNCKEAIENSYNRGYRLIEIDVSYTSDGIPVLIHNWDENAVRLFGEGKEKVPTYKEYVEYDMIDNLTQLSLEDIAMMIRSDKYKNLYFITDTKDSNNELLKYIKDNYKDIMNMFIPQVYNQDEYHIAKELGFKNVIYTLYMSKDTKEQIVEFSKEYKPYAITMDTYWAHSDLPILLTDNNIYTYTHTFNDIEKFNFLKTNGIKGIYTDILFE